MVRISLHTMTGRRISSTVKISDVKRPHRNAANHLKVLWFRNVFSTTYRSLVWSSASKAFEKAFDIVWV